MSWYQEWAPYVPVAQKLAKGQAAAKKLAAKEGRAPSPVKASGRALAKTFWGLKWCENLERYHDISNRLPRGATYVRNGSVADLVIEPGRVRAIVAGSEPYKVDVEIKALKSDAWKAISRDCAQEIESLLDLLQGRFKEPVMKRLTQADGGLFPHANEISMRCSCPDSARVCKHIAATFYGIAVKLDTQPELLFKLRNVDHLELIGHATSAGNLAQAFSGSADSVLADGDLSGIFGIELEPNAESSEPMAKSSSRRASKKKPVPAQPDVNEHASASSPTVQKKRTVKKVTVRASERQSSEQTAKPLKNVKATRKAKTATKKAVPKKAVPKKGAKAVMSPRDRVLEFLSRKLKAARPNKKIARKSKRS